MMSNCSDGGSRRLAPLSRAIVVGMTMLVAACSSAGPANLESLGLAIAADVQPGEMFEVTVTKDPSISVMDVSAPAGVTANISQPADEILTLSVDVAPDTKPGSYTLLLRTDRNGEGAELEWPFDVVEADPAAPETLPESAEEVRSRFAAALYAGDGAALQALWPASSWDPLGIDVLESFVPVLDAPPCDTLDDGRVHCFVFDEGGPWVLGLMMESRSDVWTVTLVSLDSTN
jgi:hypothetical protein